MTFDYLFAQNYVEGQYVKAENKEYTADGWLADHSFRGLYAEDLTVVTPAGPCSPTPRYFIVRGGYVTYTYCTKILSCYMLYI